MNLILFIDSDDEDLKKLYQEAVASHNNRIDGPFPDAGFDLFLPIDTSCLNSEVNKINFL